MSVVAIAQKAASVASRYAPAVVSAAEDALKARTSGKVTNLSQVADYVGKSPGRLQVTAEAMVAAGVRPADLLSHDLMGDDQLLLNIRSKLDDVAVGLRSQAGHSAAETTISEDVIAAVVLALTRTKAAMAVFGNEENYFLTTPKGGVPAIEFALRKAVKKVL